MHEYTIDVTVALKRGVADPEGDNTRKTLDLLGIEGVTRVATAKRFTMTLTADGEAEAMGRAEEACTKLLANPVIQTYTLELRKD